MMQFMEEELNKESPFFAYLAFQAIHIPVQAPKEFIQKYEAIGVEASGHAALFKGDMKITRNGPPYGDFKWRLYNLKNDPGETTDLSKSSPEIFKDLLNEYTLYASNNNVLEMAEDYDLMKEVGRKFKVKIIKNASFFVIGIGVIFILFYRRKNRRSRKNYAV
jgi:hypothetical protein